MTPVQGADILVQGDLGAHPFILDRDHLDGLAHGRVGRAGAGVDRLADDVDEFHRARDGDDRRR